MAKKLTNKFNTDPAKLRKIIASKQKSSKQNSDDYEALAEAYFRLALSPETEIEEALDCLRQSYKMDGTDPRYAYHFARLFYLHGDLDQAVFWLEKTGRLSPKSHRVWAHISLLQRQLNDDRHHNRKGFVKNDLKNKSDMILNMIKAGAEKFEENMLTFEPERSKQEKKSSTTNEEKVESESQKTKKNPCKWSGVHDLDIENNLLGDPNQEKIRNILENIAAVNEIKDKRPNWDTSILLICSEALLAGYSVQLVRNIVDKAGNAISKKVRSLLDTICQCFELELEEVPAFLAKAVKQETMPHFLAALFHSKRVFWKPIDFLEKDVYKLSQKLTNGMDDELSDEDIEKRDETIINYHKKLIEALKKMHAKPPQPADLKEIETQIKDDVTFDDLKAEKEIIQNRLKDAWRQIKDLEAILKKRPLNDDEIAQGQAVAAFICRELEKLCDQAVRTLDALKSFQTSGVDQQDIDALRKELNDCKNTGKYKPKFEKLSIPITSKEEKEKFADPFQVRLQSFNENGSPDLEKTLVFVDEEIDAMIESALGSFTVYAPEDRRHSFLKIVELMAMADAAELLHRLGKYKRAQKLWGDMLRRDRLNPVVLKNIAVSKTIDNSDPASVLLSWKWYCEILYFHAIVQHNPAEKAEERANFHFNFAAAYVNGIIENELDPQKIKTNAKTLSLLISMPGCLREYVQHTVASLLNERFQFTVPTLILGLDRSSSDRSKENSHSKLLSFVESVCENLPERIRMPFLKTCTDYYNEALEDSKNIEGLVLKKHKNYSEQKDKLIEWIQKIYQIKFQFRILLNNLFNEHENWVKKIGHIDFLFVLDGLNQLPVDLNTDYLDGAITTFKCPIHLLDGFLDDAVYLILIYIVNEFDNRKEYCSRLFHEVGESFTTQSDFWKRLLNRKLDPKNYNDKEREGSIKKFKNLILYFHHPNAFYPEIIKDASEGKASEDKAVKILKEWSDMYTRIAGPAILLANLLIKLQKKEEAIPYLERAMKNTLLEEDREQCKKLLTQVRPSEIEKYIKKKDFKGGISFIRKKLKAKTVPVEVVYDLIRVYAEWIKTHQDQVKNMTADINNDFTQCLDRLSDSLDDEDVQTIQAQKHAILVKAASAYLGEWDSIEKLEKSNKAMLLLVEMDRKNYQAMFQLATGLMHRGFAYAKNQEIEKAKKPLLNSDSYIEEILQNCQAEDILDNAREMKTQLDKIKDKIDLD